ncbi:hypothetical protein RUND412_002155 [Rhizina undulata]
MCSVPSSIPELQRLIRTHPLIDNHAHNLLLPTHENLHPLESIVSEAAGHAILDAPHSLSHLRAVKQLASWLGCEPDWDQVKEKRSEIDLEEWTRRCFQGIQCVVMDDGLDGNSVETYSAHDRYTSSPTKRIVRVEKLAEECLRGAIDRYDADENNKKTFTPWSSYCRPDNTFDDFSHSICEEWREKETLAIFNIWLHDLTAALVECLKSDEVVGFKSIICYRTGLKISQETSTVDFISSIEKVIQSARNNRNFKIKDKNFNDYIVLRVCDVLASVPESKPLQLHTGLGDNDLRLVTANPSHLQTFIEAWPTVNFVLLHSSYPFTREAGYLATLYKNVHLDFGLVFPLLSKGGQKNVVKQMLELTPGTKLLWSTDGHWFPETYALANSQMREVLSEVFTKWVLNGQLSISQAAKLTKNILFFNSNKLYNLNLTPDYSSNPVAESPHPRSITPLAITGATLPSIQKVSLFFEEFLQKHSHIKRVRLQWIDYTGTLRFRIVPISQMRKLLASGTYLGVARACLSLLQNDMTTEDMTPVGQYHLVPDLSSIRDCDAYASGHASIMCVLREGEFAEEEVETCTRTVLSSVLEKAKSKHGLDFKIGFETEVVFMQRDSSGEFMPVSKVHAWSTADALPGNSVQMTVLDEIATALEASGVELILYHPESADSQYEIVTGPLPPLQAVDALYHTRQTIKAICAKHGLHATLYPKPYPYQAGTAAHVHISVNPPENQDNFFGGVLDGLANIMAFTMPLPASFERQQKGYWAGGEWATWGEQNREVPLRLVDREQAHWEVRCVDGLANMYLGVAAIISNGCAGIAAGRGLPGSGCEVDPAELSTDEIQQLGIAPLPKGVVEEFTTLGFTRYMSQDAAQKFLLVKRSVMAFLETLATPEERKRWLMERY